MKWFIYNLLFAAAYAAMLPAFLLRMKRRGGYRARMGDRFGRYPAEILAKMRGAEGEEAPVWVHAVSVGEVQVAAQLMREMRSQDPRVRFIFSTTSSTGWKTAETELARMGAAAERDALIYNPLDFPGCVRRALDAAAPKAVVLTETEIWPNFLMALKRRGVPVFLANARISDRSAPRYRALRWFFGEAFRSFAKIFAQSGLDARRLEAAGADAGTVEVTGSFKFDVAKRNPEKEAELREWIRARTPGGIFPRVLLGASTWPGEDEVMLKAYGRILEAEPGAALVIAPRHFEKADAVEAAIRRAGHGCVRRSRGDGAEEGVRNVFLCDTTGEMMGLFGIADVAFVGKSLCAHGSQNMIEPCLCGTAAVVGPHTENFRPVMSDLLEAGAIIQAKDEEGTLAALAELFSDAAMRSALGERAKAAVERRRGATAACAAAILEAIR